MKLQQRNIWIIPTKVGIIFWFLFGTLLSGCLVESGYLERIKVASVGTSTLFLDDVQVAIGDSSDTIDTNRLYSDYINSWVREEVLYQKALEVLPEDSKNIERQLAEYKRSLIIYEYEKLFMQQKLDTNVNMKRVQEYYEKHKKEFRLRYDIVKAVYLKVKKTAQDLGKVWQWYLIRSDEDRSQLEAYANMYGEDYYFGMESWTYASDLLENIPWKGVRMNDFIKRKGKFAFQDSSNVYFVNILDYRSKNTTSPIEFEKEKIKVILSNIDARSLRTRLRTELVKEAIDAGKIEKI